MSDFTLAEIVLTAHLLAVVFIVFGLVAIPLGGWLGRPFVHVFWWRFLHFAAITVVALQKLLGKLCFLSVWEFALLDRAGRRATDVQPALGWADRMIHWDLPLWFFTALYAATWVYVAWLWYRFRPRATSTARR